MLFDVFCRAAQQLYRKMTGNQEIAKTGLKHVSLCCFAEQTEPGTPHCHHWNHFKYSHEWGAFKSHQKFNNKSSIKNLQVVLHVQHNGPDQAFISSVKVYRHCVIAHIHNVILSTFLMFHLLIPPQKLWDQLNHESSFSFFFFFLHFFQMI